MNPFRTAADILAQRDVASDAGWDEASLLAGIMASPAMTPLGPAATPRRNFHSVASAHGWDSETLDALCLETPVLAATPPPPTSPHNMADELAAALNALCLGRPKVFGNCQPRAPATTPSSPCAGTACFRSALESSALVRTSSPLGGSQPRTRRGRGQSRLPLNPIPSPLQVPREVLQDGGGKKRSARSPALFSPALVQPHRKRGQRNLEQQQAARLAHKSRGLSSIVGAPFGGFAQARKRSFRSPMMRSPALVQPHRKRSVSALGAAGDGAGLR